MNKLIQWVRDTFGPMPTAEESPFIYVDKDVDELELGDFIIAYDGFIQRIGAVEYDGSRLVVTKKGHGAAFEFQAYEGDKFTIRKLKEGK